MANQFYEPGEQRAAKVNDLFATIAPRYDFINDLQSFGLPRRWKNRLVRLASSGPGQQTLDVCCGTGDIAQRLAQTGAKVTALDFSAEMLAVARKRNAQNAGSIPPPEFVQGDAMKLPFADGTFAIVTVGY